MSPSWPCGKVGSRLSVVLDLFSRAIVGWAMAAIQDESLVTQALHMALVSRKPQTGLMHHSDRGSQYSSEGYQPPPSLLGHLGQHESDGRLLRQCRHGAVLWHTQRECISRYVIYHVLRTKQPYDDLEGN